MEILDKTGVSIMWSAIKDKYALKTNIPTKTSELINDSSFLDSAVTTGTGNVLTDLTVVNNQLQFTKGTVDTSSAESASKLTAARTIWGQSFDGTADVSGNITLDGSIISSDTRLVDLGFLSGTLWMDRNVGASSPEDAGLYFAWGETNGYTADEVGKTKQFSWDDYKFGTSRSLTKYNSTDGLTTLETTDDAVLLNIHKCSIPTKAQIEELLDFTTYECTTQNGVKGILLTSRINGNSIFIPMAGYANYGSVSRDEDFGTLWTNSLKEDNVLLAYYLVLYDSKSYFKSDNRCRGFSVRGVATPEETTNTIVLPSSSGTLALTSDVETVKDLITNSIPTKVSQLTNDAGYLTEHQSLDGYYTKTEVDTKVDGFATQDWVSSQGYAKGTVPTKTSQLTNDSGYITADDLKGTVTIALASNQSSTDTSLNGATVTVKDGSSTIGTYTWDGNAITLKVAGGQSLTVRVSAVTGYKTPSSQTFTTVTGNSRAITMTYQTEVVTVTVSASNGASMSGQKITVNGTAYTYSTSFSVKIPYGTYYIVSANDKTGYSTPSAQAFTANQATRSVTLTYTYNPTGVYILDTDGNFTTAANWNTANNSKAVGVFVGTDNCKFVIAPEDSGDTLTWGGYGTTISGIVTTTDSTTAKKDYAGSSNTDKIISQLGASKAPAANYCKSYTFKNGKSGYLWSMGEMQAAYDNKSAINTALSKIGATAMSTSYYWTSTQYGGYYAWLLHWDYGYVGNNNKNNNNYVRAVCAF